MLRKSLKVKLREAKAKQVLMCDICRVHNKIIKIKNMLRKSLKVKLREAKAKRVLMLKAEKEKRERKLKESKKEKSRPSSGKRVKQTK